MIGQAARLLPGSSEQPRSQLNTFLLLIQVYRGGELERWRDREVADKRGVVSWNKKWSESSYHVGRHRKRLVRVFVVRWARVAVRGLFLVRSESRKSLYILSCLYTFSPPGQPTISISYNPDLTEPDPVRISESPD